MGKDKSDEVEMKNKKLKITGGNGEEMSEHIVRDNGKYQRGEEKMINEGIGEVKQRRIMNRRKRVNRKKIAKGVQIEEGKLQRCLSK